MRGSKGNGSASTNYCPATLNSQPTPKSAGRPRAHTFVGTTGELAEGSGALGGLVVGGIVCSMWSAVSFLKERRHHLRFGLPDGAALPQYLRGEAFSSAKEGLFCGGVLAVTYL